CSYSVSLAPPPTVSYTLSLHAALPIASGWIKRGPVGLIGHTKGDALETIGHIIEDVEHLYTAENPDEDAILHLLAQRGIEYSDWHGWKKLDNHEISLGD